MPARLRTGSTLGVLLGLVVLSTGPVVEAGDALRRLDSQPVFEENRGQALGSADYLCRAGSLALAISEDSATTTLVGEGGVRSDVRWRPLGAAAVDPVGRRQRPGTTSYCKGNDRSKWVRGVRSFRSVAQTAVWNGIDIVWRIGGSGLAYDLIVAPGADPLEARFAVDGADSVQIEDGALVLETEAGTLRHRAPFAFQVIRDRRVPVDCGFVVERLDGAAPIVSFRVGEYDTERTLVIDPTLEFASYFGGIGPDLVNAMVSEPDGTIVCTGFSSSPQSLPGTDEKMGGDGDAFVTSVTPDGTVTTVYVGGGTRDEAFGMALDGEGGVWITGETYSRDFPVEDGPQTAYVDRAESFLTLVEGDVITFSTYIAGSGDETATDVAVDTDGLVWVVGRTSSDTDFELVNAFDDTHDGPQFQFDGFVMQLDPELDPPDFVLSSYIGGSADDRPYTCEPHPDGGIVVGGYTQSTDLPATTGAFQKIMAGFADGWIAHVEDSGITWLTYFGDIGFDAVNDLAVDAGGDVYITGRTDSTGFRGTAGAVQREKSHFDDAFVARIGNDGKRQEYLTLLGGRGFDVGLGIVVNASREAWVTGGTGSPEFPITGSSLTNSFNGGAELYKLGGDAFVSVIAPDGKSTSFSTYLGGSDLDLGRAITLLGNRRAMVAGSTRSTDFPLQDEFQSLYGGEGDVFFAELAPPDNALDDIALVESSGPHDLRTTDVRPRRADLTWVQDLDAINATAVQVQRRILPNGGFATVAVLGAFTTLFADQSVVPGQAYSYRVVAQGEGTIFPSAEIIVRTPTEEEDTRPDDDPATGGGTVFDLGIFDPPIPAPGLFTVVPQGGGRFALVWRDRASGESGYEILRAIGNSPETVVTQIGPGASVFEDSVNSSSLLDVTYRVRALFGTDSSASSLPFTAVDRGAGNLAVQRGKITDSIRFQRDKFSIMTSFEDEGPFDTNADLLRLVFGSANAPTVIVIPGRDPGWKVRKTKLIWDSRKSLVPFVPKTKLVIDLKRKRLKLNVSRFEYEESQNPAFVIFGYRFGDHSSADSDPWMMSKPRELEFDR